MALGGAACNDSGDNAPSGLQRLVLPEPATLWAATRLDCHSTVVWRTA
jgi:hypothetical protein